MDEAWIERISRHITAHQPHLERNLLPYGNPAGKDVLIFGCGKGTEVPWCVKHGARSILGIDQSEAQPDGVQRVLEQRGEGDAAYELRQQDVHDLALTGETFDLILSNGVFEHVMDLKGVLEAFRPLLRPKGRIAIHADGLWYSSSGGHMRRENWEHLWWSRQEIREFMGDRWRVYTSAVNRMTSVDFLEAIRAVGAVVLQMTFRSDPMLAQLPEYIDRVRARTEVSPTDMSISAISCELAFPETL